MSRAELNAEAVDRAPVWPREYAVADLPELLAGSPAADPALDSIDRHAAVAMILCGEHTGGLEILFIKRSEHPGDPWSGHMAFPGGGHEVEDLSLEHAARRETFEEIGLTLPADSLLGRLEDVYGGSLLPFTVCVTPFLYRCPEAPVFTLNHEVSELVLVPLEHLADGGNLRKYVYPPDPMAGPFPSIVYESYVIWGLTYRIVASFLERLGKPLPLDWPV